ncbi:MAG: nucleotidyltransferase domain-containing protein [bacterium]|nr:nucleotidyltransferase domain-containing protein [bacterium]
MFSNKEVKKIVEKIRKDYKPEKIILFGSYAWGKPTPDSDVDLLIIKNTKKTGRDVSMAINKSIFPRMIPLDILVYTPFEIKKKIKEDKNLFLEDIINNGKVLYAKS